MAVVTGLAVAAAGTAASIGMNLAAAAKQSKAQSAAEQAAAEAAKKAEVEYGKQFLGGVQIPTEAYKQALQQGTAQQMQSLQALQEADTRTLAAGVGKVQAEATQAQSSIMNQQAEDMYRLELAQAAEQSKSSDNIAKMNQERAMGAQMAAADAEAAKAKLYGSIGTSIASLGGQILGAAPLYGKKSEGFSADLSNSQNTVDTSKQSSIADRFSAVGSSFTGNAALTTPQIDPYQGSTYQAQYEALKNKENINIPYQAQYEDFLKQQKLYDYYNQ